MLELATQRLAEVGVQVRGVASGGGWQHILPGARSVAVFASAGRTLWSHLPDAPHPVDTLVARTLAGLPSGGRWVPCAMDAPVHVDFIRLAIEAGLGHRSRLGLLLHPVYGPWLALRTAWFTEDLIEPTGPLTPASPCDTCHAPCATACPAGAISPSGLALAPCLAWQAQSSSCEAGCLARVACPVGVAHAYSAEQHRYHHHPPSRADILARRELGCRTSPES